MKLVVNSTALTPPLTGIGHYTAQLTRHLIASAQVESIQALAPSGLHLVSADALTETLNRLEASSGGESASASRWQQQIRKIPFIRPLRRLLIRHRFRHSDRLLPGYRYWEPGFLRLPLDLPSAATVYDLSHLAYPEFHPPARVKLMTAGLERSIESTQKLITISEFSKQEIVRHFGVAPEKIAIVPPAVSDQFRRRASQAELEQIRAHYQLPPQFLLSVGTLEPRKNLSALLSAYGRLSPALRQRYPLVMIGSKGWCDEALDADIARFEARGEVIRLGYMPQADIPLIYQMATALAYVSLYEGYGMPVAEAMVSGIPVLTSDCTSMPEVAGSAGLKVNPHDIDAITAGLEQLLEDASLRHQCIEQGLKDAQRFCWNRSGQALEAALLELSV